MIVSHKTYQVFLPADRIVFRRVCSIPLYQEEPVIMASTIEVRRKNTKDVFQVIYDRGSISKQEIANIEFQLSNNSPAYLLSKPEQVKVKLTKHGKQIFQKKLF